MDFSYLLVLAAVLILSPFALAAASKQDKKTKTKVRLVFLFFIISQLVLGFLNWENFESGRSGISLAISYPGSLLWLFFVISAVQVLLVLLNTRFTTLYAAILNFVNTVVLFAGLLRLSSSLGFQVVSFASIGAVFLCLAGNVVSLILINRDKNIIKKYPFKI
ncbi:MAG TPA: hypothetical protein VJG66_00920 [Patescibacteria group bacterium]|nr:hypothetical protein [Patescibacteria group bacterium]